ncbi:MAG TPA: transcriptional regulator [Campylobacterales bacterium]|nr:transcriptional regulator [Campylobacterales bacterium]
MITFNDKSYTSSTEIFFEIFNDKWKLFILWLLINETKRFKELSSTLNITEKTLSLKLKELEKLHLIKREVFAEVPLRVEYSLTPYGASLKPLFEDILHWSQAYAKEFSSLS